MIVCESQNIEAALGVLAIPCKSSESRGDGIVHRIIRHDAVAMARAEKSRKCIDLIPAVRALACPRLKQVRENGVPRQVRFPLTMDLTAGSPGRAWLSRSRIDFHLAFIAMFLWASTRLGI